MNWNILLSLGEKIVDWFWNSKEVKEFVVKLLERYSDSTDNDIDDSIVEIVRSALLK